jgi:hypothetical protein
MRSRTQARRTEGALVKTAKLQRTRVIELITREVKRLVRVGDEDDTLDDTLDHVMSIHLGWCNNYGGRSARDIARAFMALLPLADDEDAYLAAAALIFYRETGKGFTSEAANATVRRTLEPLGVPYAACGCLAFVAASADLDCCDVALAARKAAA